MQDKVPLGVRHHRTVLVYHPAYEPYLCRLGLYQVATMTRINLDPAGLIHGLVERWRPETHTFHLPVGEMTVTLQDVSCLWGLLIHGVPVGGVSDGVCSSGAAVVGYDTRCCIEEEESGRGNGAIGVPFEAKGYSQLVRRPSWRGIY